MLEDEALEIDYCVSCGGIWLDSGELELLFGDDAACRRFLDAGQRVEGAKEKPRKCPICNKRMGKERLAGDPPIVYDHCPRGDGLWFDRGELGHALAHGGAELDPDVAEFLRHVFQNPEATGVNEGE